MDSGVSAVVDDAAELRRLSSASSIWPSTQNQGGGGVEQEEEQEEKDDGGGNEDTEDKHDTMTSPRIKPPRDVAVWTTAPAVPAAAMCAQSWIRSRLAPGWGRGGFAALAAAPPPSPPAASAAGCSDSSGTAES